ncbi:uncharacterized protein ACJ7VT_000237 [Polymixia lowei]
MDAMEMLKIERVVVGTEMMATSATSAKSEPVKPSSLQPYQHDSLQCFQCFITFCNAKARERHMKMNHREEYMQQLQQTNTVFSCYMCNRSFSSSKELVQHQPSHSTEDKPFRCTYCQERFHTFRELAKHQRRKCPERQYVCKDCGIVFRTPGHVRTHRMYLHPQLPEDDNNDTKTYYCGKCNRGFQTEEELVKHQESFADDQNCDVRPPAKKRIHPPSTAAEREMPSDKKSKDAEEGEAREEEGNDESPTKGTKQWGRPPKEEQTEMELKIPCPEENCDLVFPSVGALRAHKKSQHGPPPPPRKAQSVRKAIPSLSSSKPT